MDGRQVKRGGTVSFRCIFEWHSPFPVRLSRFPFFTRRAISQVTWPIDLSFFEDRENLKVFSSCDEQGNIGEICFCEEALCNYSDKKIVPELSKSDLGTIFKRIIFDQISNQNQRLR